MSDRMFGMNKWMKVLAYTVLGIYTVVVAYPILFMFLHLLNQIKSSS